MTEKNPNIFHGCLRPEPYNFTFGVDQLIILDDAIAFDASGVMSEEPWSIKGGRLKKTGYGHYRFCHFSGSDSYPEGGVWRIYILGYEIIGDECYLDGLWFEPDEPDEPDAPDSDYPQGGGFWTFEGQLTRLSKSSR